MRILICDDSAFMRRAIRTMLESDPNVQIVGIARNGREAVEMATRLEPDLITMDIEMPEMDGLTALRHIMHQCPTQVIMLSSLTTAGSHAALQALKLGAADVLAKDSSQFSLSITNIQEDLLAKVRVLGKGKPIIHRAQCELETSAPRYRPGQFDVVCIGSSTGGPPVLETILPSLPGTLRCPVVVAQHMPEVFTRSMSERLNDVCNLPVVHIESGMALESGTIYLAPGGHNTHLRKVRLAKYELIVNDEPAGTLYKPSVDALLGSAAKATASRTLGIVLTGIGEDGLQGARMLKEVGGTLLAQNQETCVVYGMPKAVTQAGIIDASLSPTQIASALQTLAPDVGRRAG